jgi:hypothetical protein
VQHGDDPDDYKSNTQGMTDAANKLGKPTPAARSQTKTQKTTTLLTQEIKNLRHGSCLTNHINTIYFKKKR